jgi:hypothetical protein
MTAQAAAAAESGADVAPAKASPKNGTGKKKGAPKGKKPAEVAKPKAAGKTKKATPGKSAAKAAKAEKSTAGFHEGSKTAQVVAMLQGKNGATLAEITEKMGWQKHTVRGLISTLGSKHGLKIDSSRREDGAARVYSIAGGTK